MEGLLVDEQRHGEVHHFQIAFRPHILDALFHAAAPSHELVIAVQRMGLEAVVEIVQVMNQLLYFQLMVKCYRKYSFPQQHHKRLNNPF